MIGRSAYIKEVQEKCASFKSSGFWPPEPVVRPTAWIENFKNEDDRFYACRLLDNFVYFNHTLTQNLLVASFQSLPDAIRESSGTRTISEVFQKVVFTAVSGENPNVTDSGYLLCRNARQLIGIPEELFVMPEVALREAYNGTTVIFCDDFIGSGDQFISSWRRKYPLASGTPGSFEEAQALSGFKPLYLGLVSTEGGKCNIAKAVPSVGVCVCHVIDKQHTVFNIDTEPYEQAAVIKFLNKFEKHLNPGSKYMDNNSYKTTGYKNYGLLLGFEHSTPDATLPIFWSEGFDSDWVPLVKRT